jgi:hypothetical protein
MIRAFDNRGCLLIGITGPTLVRALMTGKPICSPALGDGRDGEPQTHVCIYIAETDEELLALLKRMYPREEENAPVIDLRSTQRGGSA